MKRTARVSVIALSALCTACSSHLATLRVGRAGAVAKAAAQAGPDDVRPGAYGNTDAKKPATDPQPSTAEGTAQDRHSEIASGTPDGGKSATTSATAAPPTEGTPVPDGAEVSAKGVDKGANDRAAADIAAADKAGSDKSGDAHTQDADGKGADATDAKLKPGSGNRPVDESDPSILGPSSASKRNRT